MLVCHQQHGWCCVLWEIISCWCLFLSRTLLWAGGGTAVHAACMPACVLLGCVSTLCGPAAAAAGPECQLHGSTSGVLVTAALVWTCVVCLCGSCLQQHKHTHTRACDVGFSMPARQGSRSWLLDGWFGLFGARADSWVALYGGRDGVLGLGCCFPA